MTLSEERLRELLAFADRTGAEEVMVPLSALTELLSLRSDAHTNAKDELREHLRLTAVEQPTTDGRDTYSDGFAQGLFYAIQRLDALSIGHPIQGEAVAWRWRYRGDTIWSMSPNRPGQFPGDEIEVEPLFASHPPTPAGVREITDEMVERAMARAGWITKATPPEYESGHLISPGLSEEEAEEISASLRMEMREILNAANGVGK